MQFFTLLFLFNIPNKLLWGPAVWNRQNHIVLKTFLCF